MDKHTWMKMRIEELRKENPELSYTGAWLIAIEEWEKLEQEEEDKKESF